MARSGDETLVPGPSVRSQADEQTQPSPDDHDDRQGRLDQGTTVGRYVVLEELGAGAMGRVYAAYDPRLDRRVALKVLRLDRNDAAMFRRAERRLLREAQALAKLSHPNVVTVHDVESVQGSLVVAMDYIEGQTLRRWRSKRERAWVEVLDVMRQAGEGLAAAHRAGLVHRDFKPDNLMIDRDGRAHVVDFGLARAFDPRRFTEDVEDEPMPGEGETDTDQTHGQAGTPAYMAPEQHLGQKLGPASDQFAFCVALYEALYGRHPFEGDTLVALTASVLEGRLRPPPRDSDVPTRIRDAVRQGLALEPEDRHPDMEVLLQALRHDPGARRRRWVTVMGGVGLAAVAAYGYLGPGVAAGPVLCTGGRGELAGIWDDDTRAAAAAAVRATERPYVEYGWAQAEAHLDVWAEGWASMHDEACAATRLRGEQSERLLDLRMACLRRHQGRLRAAVDVLVAADEAVAERVVRIATGLPPLAACADAEALLAAVPPPEDPQVRSQVEQVQAGLAEAMALEHAGKYGAAREAAVAATDEAARLGYAPAHAEALSARGHIEDRAGDPAAAEQSLSAAVWLAQRSGHDAVVARASCSLTSVVGSQLGRTDEGLQWARHADAAVGRLGEVALQVDLLNGRAMVLLTAGRYGEAEVDLRRALRIREERLPPDPLEVSSLRANLGLVVEEQGRAEEALALYDRVLVDREQMLGPEHPRVAALLTNSAQLLAAQGRPQEALPRAHRAIEIYTAAVGHHHPDLASAHNNLAVVYFSMDDYDAAIAAMGQALEIWEVVRGAEHPDLGDAHLNLGAMFYLNERKVPAREHFERALAIYEGAHGLDHPAVANALLNLGELDADEGQLALACERHERMVAILRRSLPAEHPRLGQGLAILASDYLEVGRLVQGQEAAEEALRVFERPGGEPRRRAQARYLVARARHGRGIERRAAVAQAREALVDADEDVQQDITQWLADIGQPQPPP